MYQIQYILDYESARYLIILIDLEDREKSFDTIKLYYSDDEEDYSEYEILVYLLKGENVVHQLLKDLSDDLKKVIGDNIVQDLSKEISFVANPYFDELMIFFGNTIYTSQEKYKPITCEQCGKVNLYQKGEKTNKSDYISRIHEMLIANKNVEWPFKEDLLVQFSVSDKESRLKKVDLDNIAKTLFDSLQGIVYFNDSQIISVAGDKTSVLGKDAFIVAIKRLFPGERPIYQEFLFSGKRNAWKSEYAQKKVLNKLTRFVSYKEVTTESDKY